MRSLKWTPVVEQTNKSTSHFCTLEMTPGAQSLTVSRHVLMLRLNLHKQLWQDFKQACELICVSRSELPAWCFSKSALIFHVMWPELSRPPRRGRYWNILHRVCAKPGHILCVLILSSPKSRVILSVPGHCNNCWDFRNGTEHLQALHGEGGKREIYCDTARKK